MAVMKVETITCPLAYLASWSMATVALVVSRSSSSSTAAAALTLSLCTARVR
eukprot:CAMPEP_0204287554 /NCGR_PEP_ID=MMETSP0468-20130131/55015_1 /ASSEMBLY_ACC=CAM_ASM_000383 /TAXON_ID=2969 /ORGANISM="Oxyrrhis marina" /LENGTH=51 /DNA_ID=CAMNT_0051265553 /DNA_START=324 /DNA_END=476 /DNA_ORIENTATION=+